MNTSLTTFDGFPRNDIDVPQIRTTRARIIRLKNDHKAVMSKIETAVHEQFAKGADASARQEAAQVGARAATESQIPSGATLEPPFAKVNTVAPGSPAASAGLQVGDKVTRFGIVNFTNHERLGKISQVVQQNQNVRRKVQYGVRHLTDGNSRDLYLCECYERLQQTQHRPAWNCG